MKRNIICLLVLFLLSLSACSRRGGVEYQAFAESLSENKEETGQDAEEEPASVSDNEEEPEEESQEVREISLFVDISGEVARPGVYELPVGNRVFHAIVAAGGFTDRAETRCVNQADQLFDGEKSYIYSREEAEQLGGWMQLTGSGGTVLHNSSPQTGSDAGSSDGKVNLNLADKSLLMTLPGVGEARAEAIIAYRESNGAFSTIEDIMNITGIKEKLFEQIRDKITV